MFATILTILTILPLTIIAQSASTVLCVPGQCIQGFSNTTIGATITAPGAPTSLHLLPGQYTSSTNPKLLHDTITSSSASLSLSSGFENSSVSTSTISLPLNLALEPGLAIYSGSFYSGESGFTNLPSSPLTNQSIPLTAKALSLSANVWVAVKSNSQNRIILWDSIPDISQLPQATLGSLSLLDIQSSACSPSCAGSGICTASGTCQCASGFTGASCESCASGFFGPTCQACPAGCTSCDEGITGSGRCLESIVTNAPSTCNCLNGVCGTDGQCACNAGFTRADNGTDCAKCQPGFFLTSTGDCKICQLGCTDCADGTGVCITCKTGFSQDANDRTKCNSPQSVTSSGTPCPSGSFSSGNLCSPCSPSCQTCTAGTSNDCVTCATGSFAFNGGCVTTNTDGVCQGSGLIADNNKKECDTCGAKCTSCKIPNFSVASTVDQLQCTGCLPGSVLSNGKCLDSCPSGTFLSPQDNLTCTACDSSCGTCSGSSTFCLTCTSNQLAFNGKCVSSCPSNTFSSSNSCLNCHPDCATCSGGSFNQCSSCPPSRPVLLNGRCLPICSKSQFFDPTSSSCQTCDSSCSSCSGQGPSNCLACSSNSQVLRDGTCVAATCQQNTTVIPGLGACLSDLVVVPPASGTGTSPPLPSITGLTTTITPTGTRRSPLAWWQILLMALGCAFIFIVFIWCCRRRARKRRDKRTALFAQGAKATRGKSSWRWRLLRFGEKLFGHTRSKKVPTATSLGPIRLIVNEDISLSKLRAAEEAWPANEDTQRLVASQENLNANSRNHRLSADERSLSDVSMYSQVTGAPRRGPDPRQPLRKDILSRLSGSTIYSFSQEQSGSKNPFRKF